MAEPSASSTYTITTTSPAMASSLYDLHHDHQYYHDPFGARLPQSKSLQPSVMSDIASASTPNIGVTATKNGKATQPPRYAYDDMARSKTDPRLDRSKRRRSQKEEKKMKKKLKEIGKNHPEFELSYDLLLGIRTSTSTVNSSIMRSSVAPADDDSSDDDDEELDKEFRDSKRYSFPSGGSSQTPPHHMNDFEFKDYCRAIFAQLRTWFGITPQTYLLKLCGGFNLLEFISNSKSGQFFFYSHDGQFLIKSMSRTECKFMRNILPQYYYHVKNQPNTLLNKFYGMYRVKTPNREPIHFIVMGSVFYTELEIHKIYDLKGSTHGRKATEKDRTQDTPVLKDIDFLENKEVLQIGRKSKLFVEQLRRDTELLRKLNIMDYSLLVGFHYASRPTQSAWESDLELEESHSAEEQKDAAQEEEEEQKDKPSISAQQQQRNEMEPKQSTTTASNGPRYENDSDLEEKRDVTKLAPAPSSPQLRALNGHGRGPSLQRVTSRRISQLPGGGSNARYNIKTPLEKHFDMPELVDVSRIAKEDDKDDDEYTNIFTTEHGGMQQTCDDGSEGDAIYFIGIIDILQKYNKRKKVENFFRGLNTDTSTISAVPPEQYAQRMYEFLKDKII